MQATPKLNPETITEINNRKWFHTIDFGNGVRSRGSCTPDLLQTMADIFFQDDVAGKTVLDIGCWDGFFSVEAARRGASRVLATDHFVWHNIADRANCDLACSVLAPGVAEVRDIDVLDLTPESVGTFDLVIFSGVLYHMRHPLLALEHACSVCNGTIIVETHLDASNIDRPAMIFYPGIELWADPTNWWGPNRLCVEAMLRDRGFEPHRFTPRPDLPNIRGIFHAVRKSVYGSAEAKSR